jgi:hypothetical protein
MALRVLALAALALVLIAPAASAHQAAFSVDQKYRFSVGHLNEPVTTYVKTGLDLILTLNDSARTPVPQLNPGNLTATLVAPDGKELTMALQNQFGTVNHFTFVEPYVLTRSGVYHLRVAGNVFGSAVDFSNVAVGSATPVPPMGNVTFPDSKVLAPVELQGQLVALQDEVNALKARLNSVESGSSKGAPSLSAVPGFVLLLAAVAVAAHRRA